MLLLHLIDYRARYSVDILIRRDPLATYTKASSVQGDVLRIGMHTSIMTSDSTSQKRGAFGDDNAQSSKRSKTSPVSLIFPKTPPKTLITQTPTPPTTARTEKDIKRATQSPSSSSLSSIVDILSEPGNTVTITRALRQAGIEVNPSLSMSVLRERWRWSFRPFHLGPTEILSRRELRQRLRERDNYEPLATLSARELRALLMADHPIPQASRPPRCQGLIHLQITIHANLVVPDDANSDGSKSSSDNHLRRMPPSSTNTLAKDTNKSLHRSSSVKDSGEI